jgi:hypothetical protein
MPYVARDYEAYKGKIVGDGNCVPFVRACSGAPASSTWKTGIKVLGAGNTEIAKGTVIATMVDGQYPGESTGNHAAIYLGHDVHNIHVLDQWVGHPVSERNIHSHGGHGSLSNDADAYYVVE